MLELLRTVTDYCGAASAHMAGLAAVIRANQRYTVPLVGRSILEHAQRALWLLEATHNNTSRVEDRLTARERAARAQIENLYSDHHYRDTIEKLIGSSEALQQARRHYKERKKTIQDWFPGAVVDGLSSGWLIEGQCHLGPTAMSKWYFDTMGLGARVDGIYDALSGWSHPTVWGIRDCQQVSEGSDGGVVITWVRDDSFIEKVCFNVVTTAYRMLSQVHGYYEWDETDLLAWADTVNAALPGAIVP